MAGRDIKKALKVDNEFEIGFDTQQRFEVLSFLLTYIIRTGIFLKLYWRISFAVCWAIFLLPFVVIYDSLEIRCAYIVLLVAGYWVTECLPIGITSLIPVVLFPLFGILSSQDTCTCYMNDTIMVFISGLILAIATEHCNLHLRIALIVMKTLGCSHAKLLGGICIVTTFISMWIANAAATAMMVPIAFAVLRELERVISQNLKNLGPMTFHEISIAILFMGCIFLWVFRAPGFVRGWSEVLTNVMIADSMPAVFVCLLMFFIPKEPIFIHFYSKDSFRRPTRSSEGLITWEIIQKKMPWRLVFLLGSGFAVSKGSSVSGLAMKVGLALVPLKELPPLLMLSVVLLFVNTLTEFTSNVGTANILLPVVAHMCVAMKIHPLYLMMPVTLTCSYAFRMPVSTPPNAIITVAGHLQTRILIAVGCFPAMYSLIVQVILFPTWGAFIYGIDEFPAWAEQHGIESIM